MVTADLHLYGNRAMHSDERQGKQYYSVLRAEVKVSCHRLASCALTSLMWIALGVACSSVIQCSTLLARREPCKHCSYVHMQTHNHHKCVWGCIVHMGCPSFILQSKMELTELVASGPRPSTSMLPSCTASI